MSASSSQPDTGRNREVPLPKRRPYNPEFDHTIRVGEYPIRYPNLLAFLRHLAPASHLVISAHDPAGALMWEMNGLPTDSDGRPSGDSVTSVFNPNDFIKVHEHRGPDGHLSNHTVNQRAVLWGSEADIDGYGDQMRATGRRINSLDLPYRFFDQNSNSSAGTQFNEVGVDRGTILRNRGLLNMVPGFGNPLLPGEQKPSKQQPGYEYSHR